MSEVLPHRAPRRDLTELATLCHAGRGDFAVRWRMATRVLVAMLAAQLACVHTIDRKVGPTLATVDAKAPFLKVHMKNGDLYVLEAWKFYTPGVLSGTGTHLGTDRRPASTAKAHHIPFADVALYETNTVQTSGAVAGLAVITGASIVLSIACLTNPKACFGSCPTFYAPGERGDVLQAEGFSDSIAPSLEANDIDALYRTRITDGTLTLRMTNEAYETHVVKGADVLAVRRPAGSRVLSTGDQLWLAAAVTPAVRCAAPEGDCRRLLAAVDGRDRTSLTDEHDLATRETIELDFDVPDHARRAGEGARQAGIVIASRQSLVTTFLLYQGLAYLGSTAGEWLAALERGELGRLGNGRQLQKVLGGIDVQVPDGAGGWRTVGTSYETGPLATDVRVVALPEGERAERIRLRLPMGGWRIDHVARAELVKRVEPIRIAPRTIRGTLGKEFAAGRTPATTFPIITQPGDAYELVYDVPRGDIELFLDSRGYYLEWMRAEWLRDEDPVKAVRMFLDPEQALRDLAPAWKRMEPEAEALFWRSRYARP